MHTTRNRVCRSRSSRAVSANRPPGYERPWGAAPRQGRVLNPQAGLAKLCPETALMAAMLEDAFLCFHKQFEIAARHGPQTKQAERWFFSDDSDWLFSFVSVCKALRLEPNFIRHGLKDWNQAGLDSPP